MKIKPDIENKRLEATYKNAEALKIATAEKQRAQEEIDRQRAEMDQRKFEAMQERVMTAEVLKARNEKNEIERKKVEIQQQEFEAMRKRTAEGEALRAQREIYLQACLKDIENQSDKIWASECNKYRPGTYECKELPVAVVERLARQFHAAENSCVQRYKDVTVQTVGLTSDYSGKEKIKS